MATTNIVGRAFLLTGKNAVKSFHGLQVLLKEFRTLNGCFVRAGKVGFQTEVQADCITQPWKNLICCLIFNCETKPKIVHRITFHREGLDLSFDLSGLEILVFLPADDKLIAVKQFVARLLKRKRLIFTHFFETGKTAFFSVLLGIKKSLVTAVQSFNHVLKRLRTHFTQVPIGFTFLEFRQMLLEGVFRHRFSVKPVEPPCESHAMVPRQCTGIDLSVQFLIALRRKELVFVGSHG